MQKSTFQIIGFWPTGASRFDSSRNSVQNAIVDVDFGQFPTPFVPIFDFHFYFNFSEIHVFPGHHLQKNVQIWPLSTSGLSRFAPPRNSTSIRIIGIFTALTATRFVNIFLFILRFAFRTQVSGEQFFEPAPRFKSSPPSFRPINIKTIPSPRATDTYNTPKRPNGCRHPPIFRIPSKPSTFSDDSLSIFFNHQRGRSF